MAVRRHSATRLPNQAWGDEDRTVSDKGTDEKRPIGGLGGKRTKFSGSGPLLREPP